MGKSPSKSIFVFILIAILCLGFGSKKKDELQLENVLQYQKEREREQQAKVEKKVPQPAPPVASPAAAAPAPKAEAVTPEVVSNIAAHPPELKFFVLPRDFRLLNDKARSTFIMEDEGKNPSSATAVWRLQGKDLTILATKISPRITNWDSYTPSIFENELHNMAFDTARYYDVNYRSRASHKILKIGGVYCLKTSTFYLLNTEWRGDIHYLFIYTPEFALNILLTGLLPEVVQNDAELQKTITDFAEHLKAEFPAGLPLKPEPASPEPASPAPAKAAA